MKHRGVQFLSLLFALTLVAAACGRDDNVSEAPGFDGKTIKVGVLEAQTGPVADPIGKPLSAGADAYWARVNAAGGVGGKYKVEQVKEDTAYSPDQAKAKYTKIKNDVVMFSQILGTPSTKTVLVDMKTDKIAGSPASLDAAWVTEPNLMPVGSTYQLQFVNAASWLINDEGFKTKPICQLAIESEYGQAGIEGLTHAAQALKFSVAATERFKGTADEVYTSQITKLKNAKCEAVFLTALPSNTGRILGAGAQAGFKPRWIGQSPSWVSTLAASPQLLPLLQATFYLTAEGTTWGDTSVPGMKAMMDDVGKYTPNQKPDIYFVFGYAQAKAVHAVLEKAVDEGDLSREGILDAISKVDVDFEGLFGNYNYGRATERQPSKETVIFKVNPAVPGALEKVKAVESDAAKALKVG